MWWHLSIPKLLTSWICWNVLVLVVHKLPNGRLNMMGLFHTVMLGTWNGRNLCFHHLHPPIKPTRQAPLTRQNKFHDLPLCYSQPSIINCRKEVISWKHQTAKTIRIMIRRWWFRNPASTSSYGKYAIICRVLYVFASSLAQCQSISKASFWVCMLVFGDVNPAIVDSLERSPPQKHIKVIATTMQTCSPVCTYQISIIDGTTKNLAQI